MRALIWISLIIGVGIFFWQNPQPVVLSFLGGSVKMQLPLATWVIVFCVAGAFSSVLVLGLNRTSSKRSPQVSSYPATKSSRPSPQPPFTPEISSTQVNSSSSDFNSDWQSALPAEEQEAWDDWEAETTTDAAATPSQDKVEKSPMQQRRPEIEPDPPTLRNFEVSQQAEDISQQGSLYSYRYRKKTQENSPPTPSVTESITDRPEERSISEESEQRPRARRLRRNQSDEVYDANYRVILPPYRPPEESNEDEDEEDWV